MMRKVYKIRVILQDRSGVRARVDLKISPFRVYSGAMEFNEAI